MNGRLRLTVAALGAFVLGAAADRALLGHRAGGEPERLAATGIATTGAAPPEEREGPGDPATEGEAPADGRGDGRPAPDERSPEEAEEHGFREALDATTAETIGQLAASLRAGAAAGGDEARVFGRLMETYRRWADLDPRGALGAALGESDGRLREAAVHTLFRTLAERDLGAAQGLLAEVADPDLRREAVHAMAGAGRESPAAFGRFLESLPEGREFGWFFRDWAAADPAQASAWVASVENPTMRSEWIRGVTAGWAKHDRAGAAAWVEGLSGTADHWPATLTLVEEIARDDPASAADLVDAIPASHRRRDLVERVAGRWASRDLEGALAWAESQPGSTGAAALDSVLREWTRADPAAAADYVNTLPASEWALDAAHRVAEQWSLSDREAALAWALDSDNPERRGHGLRGAIVAWAEHDPAAAAAFAGSLGDDPAAREAVGAAARRWAEVDAVAAVAWLDGLTPEARRVGTREILDQLAHDDPRTAAGLYEVLASGELGALTPGSDHARDEQLGDAAAHIAGRWSEFGPADAAAWAGSLPDGEARHRAVGEVADHWVRVDPVGASEWISRLPPGEARDAAAGRLVGEIARSDPEAAIRWARSVGSEEHRTDLVDHVLRQWEAVDPNAARAARETAGRP